MESFAQLLDVGFVEFTFLVQDFGRDTFRAKNGDQVFLAEIIGIHQRAKDFHRGSIRNGMIPQVSCFRDFDYLAHGVCGKAFFRKLALALQRQFQRVRKIRFGLFDGFALRNRGRNLLHKAGIATLFGGFKNGCQFHASRLSHPPMADGRALIPKNAFGCPVLRRSAHFASRMSLRDRSVGMLHFPAGFFRRLYFSTFNCRLLTSATGLSLIPFLIPIF